MLYLLELLKVIGLIPNTQDYQYLGGSHDWATHPGCAMGCQGDFLLAHLAGVGVAGRPFPST